MIKIDRQPVFKKPEKLMCSITVDPLQSIDEEYLKREAAAKIANEIIFNNYIHVVRQPSFGLGEKDTYKFYVQVVPNDMTNMILMEDVIIVDGELFNTEQVEKAVKETYPEYFI